MSAEMFGEWLAFAELEPFGETRADLRAGVLASLQANLYRNERKRAEPYDPGDFFPTLKPRAAAAPLPWQALLIKMQAIGAQLKDKRR